MAWRLDDLPVFVAVAEHGGVTAAAGRLRLPKSTVSKALARLEADLGLRLLERNTRALRLTDEGALFLRHARAVLEQAEEASAAMAGRLAAPSGRFTVALPIAFTREIVAPHLGAFQAAHPLVELEVRVTSHPVDMLREDIDLAVIVGELADSDLIVKPLLSGGLAWVATPEVAGRHALRGAGIDAALAHLSICETRYARRDLPLREEGRRRLVDLSRVTRVNDPIAAREVARAGHGLTFLPRRYCARDLEAGTLVEVCQGARFDLAASTLSAVYSSRRLLPGRTRAFLDFLIRVTREEGAP